MEHIISTNGKSGYYIFRRYVTRKGKRVYPKKAKFFKIWIEDQSVIGPLCGKFGPFFIHAPFVS